MEAVLDFGRGCQKLAIILRGCGAGLEKTRVFFKKNPAQWVFWVFLGFFGFYWVFLGFIGFFKFGVCDMTFCCILLHLNVLLDM
jgi:hypothetical protein